MKPKVKVRKLIDTNQIVSNKSLFYFLAKEDSGGNPDYPDVHAFIYPSISATLDLDYMIGFSGEKYFSPLAMRMIEVACSITGVDFEKFLFGELTNTEKNNISGYLFGASGGFTNIIYNRFKTKWEHIWDALNTAYNPLENYSMHQVRTPDLTHTTNGTGTTETESDSGVYGFNSGSANNSGKVVGNQTDTITDRTETETGTDTLDRNGNIGVTSSQQMLEQEWQVRQHDFYKMIYEDIDSILCLLSY